LTARNRAGYRRRAATILGSLAILVGAIGCFHSFYNDPDACSLEVPCADPARPYCDRGVCVPTPVDGGDTDMPLPPQSCHGNTDCTRAVEPICDLMTGFCRGCSPVDGGASSECSAISGTRPFCAPSGACTECLTSRDCISSGKTCDATAGSCVACKTNLECASGLCNGGSCADPSTLIYVSISGPSCATGGPGSGTLNDPYCAIQTGMDRGATNGRDVIVFSGSYHENVLAQTSASDYVVRVVGVGQPTLSPPATGPAFRVANSSHNLNVTLDGFVVESASGTSGHGISCGSLAPTTAATKLTVLRSTIRNCGQHGVDASSCAITLDQDVVGPGNAQGGIYLTSSDFTITNALVTSNGTAGTSGSTVGGVAIAGTFTQGRIVNATIVGNRMKTGALSASALTCSSAPVVFNVVAQGNTGGSATSEMDAANCLPSYSAFVAATSGTMNQDISTCGVTQAQQAQALFVDANNGNYHPRTGGTTPCTLVGDGTTMFMSVQAPTTDLDGTTRTTPFDIGAY